MPRTFSMQKRSLESLRVRARWGLTLNRVNQRYTVAREMPSAAASVRVLQRVPWGRACRARRAGSRRRHARQRTGGAPGPQFGVQALHAGGEEAAAPLAYRLGEAPTRRATSALVSPAVLARIRRAHRTSAWGMVVDRATTLS